MAMPTRPTRAITDRIAVLAGLAALLFVLLAPTGLSPHGARPSLPVSLAPPVEGRGVPASALLGPPDAVPSVVRPVHPGPAPASRAAFQGHYYTGSIYDGPNTTASDVAVDIGVPQDTPQSGDFYYVLVSVWDQGQSYDQLGFANDYGVWGVTYSTTSPCAQSYYFNADAFNLTAGARSRFDMSISAGTVRFRVSTPGGPILWSYSTSTGGSSFVLSQDFQCGGGSSLDYTDYEEVDQSAAPEPPYAFSFTNNSGDGAPVATWTDLSAGSLPPTIAIAIDSDATTIENEPFAFAPPPALDAEHGVSPRPFTSNVSVEALNGSTAVTLSMAGTIPSSTVSLSEGSGSSPFVFQVDLDLSNSTALGSYLLELQATAPAGSYARVALVVDVVGPLQAVLPTVSARSVDVNQSITLREAAQGGAGRLQYDWAGLPGNCSAPASTMTCLPVSSGSYAISVTVRDALGFEARSGNVSVSVSPALSVTGRVSRASLDLGQSVSFSATVRGGSGGVRFDWVETPRTPCDPSGGNLTCVPYELGSLNVSVTVNDSNGAIFELRPTTVEVLSDPNAWVSATPSQVEVGQQVEFQASATGGSWRRPVVVGRPAGRVRESQRRARGVPDEPIGPLPRPRGRDGFQRVPGIERDGVGLGLPGSLGLPAREHDLSTGGSGALDRRRPPRGTRPVHDLLDGAPRRLRADLGPDDRLQPFGTRHLPPARRGDRLPRRDRLERLHGHGRCVAHRLAPHRRGRAHWWRRGARGRRDGSGALLWVEGPRVPTTSHEAGGRNSGHGDSEGSSRTLVQDRPGAPSAVGPPSRPWVGRRAARTARGSPEARGGAPVREGRRPLTAPTPPQSEDRDRGSDGHRGPEGDGEVPERRAHP